MQTADNRSHADGTSPAEGPSHVAASMEDATRTASTTTGSGRPAEKARFVTGTVLAGRYRIVNLIGRGGMGEVYQAEDLKLEQPVALKFLPDSLALSPAALARFHGEARLARQVSHPNVCRVYDIGEVDGLQFLTMEYIDGEDLASLLRRIGRIPGDKALQIARQLCAGLAAAHDAGVLHRDLKPANVMIDGRGRARIADFGIAAAHGAATGDGLVGTPAYMAPELLQGHDASVRSDVFSLGLVLYEVFTGSPAFGTVAPADALLHRSTGQAVLTPSSRIPDLDPLVERAILRCLEKDPSRRPASAVQVAAALPGGDPLHAAIAAGETPSPEMVAASGGSEGLRPVVAGAVFLTTVALLIAAAWLRTQVSVAARVPMELPPEVLAHKARETIARFGYGDHPADTAYGFVYDMPYVRHNMATRGTADRWAALESGRPPAILFWYRESPEPLVVVVRERLGGPPRVGPVTEDNPAFSTPGMRTLRLDPLGRLVAFRTLLPELGSPSVEPQPIDWDSVFALAGLDASAFSRADPQWTPNVASDTHAAWTGSHPGRPDLPLRVEAAASRGRLVAFELFEPWDPPLLPAVTRPSRVQRGSILVGLMVSSLVAVGALLAWSNVRRGRGDKRGAFRLAAFIFVVRMLSWLLDTDHVIGPGELLLFRLGMSDAVIDAVSAYLLYLALEPSIRRRWPSVLIAWNRALAGRLRDPLVGRAVLAGIACAAANSLLGLWQVHLSGITGTGTQLGGFLSVRRVAAGLVHDLGSAVFVALALAFLAFLLRELLRREWLAAAALAMIFGVIGSGGEVTAASTAGIGAVLGVFTFVVLTRFGLAALTAFLFAGALVITGPALLALSAWYSGVALFTLGTVIAVAAAALSASIRRPTAEQGVMPGPARRS